MNIQEFENFIKEKNKKHIIFDFDETICELLINWDNWCKEIEEVASRYEIGFNPSEFGFQNAQNVCIEKGGKEARDEILEISYKNEKDYYSGYELSPVVLPLIKLAKEYANLYIWTSNDQRTVMPILKELKIDTLFDKVVARNDVNFIKPNPEGFNLVYDKNNPKSEYLIIGNSKADEGAGKNAGIDFINIAELKL
ncbi:MAG TPA: HAD hydrolase-like protein [Candidatus Moranbacteria bacterium]|nr:HAD hydrolase-like protein [Candidatus Moranbacteria bacterium]